MVCRAGKMGHCEPELPAGWACTCMMLGRKLPSVASSCCRTKHLMTLVLVVVDAPRAGQQMGTGTVCLI